MRTWILDLTYQRGPLDGDQMRAPRGTQIREMGLELLGEHATATGTHDNDLKPRALHFHPPGPQRPGTLTLTWLSDQWPPTRTPPASGLLNWGQGTSVVAFTTRDRPVTVTAAALRQYFLDHPDTETWTGCRLRTRSGVLFKREHAHYLSAAHLLDAAIQRWHLITAWTPPGIPPVESRLPIPQQVIGTLLETTTLTVRHCASTTPHQIATARAQPTPAIRETPLEFDIDLHCRATGEALPWFRTLCAFAEIASLGRYTPTGLGALTATPYT